MAVKKGQIKTVLTFDRATKGTYVFTSEEADAPIPALYIKKHGFPNGNPESVTVTVDPGS